MDSCKCKIAKNTCTQAHLFKAAVGVWCPSNEKKIVTSPLILTNS